jgi:UDP-glucose 4-epimerase
LLAASSPRKLRGEVLNVACGERTSLNGLLRHIGEIAGGPLDPEFRPPRTGDVRDSLADIRAARGSIGFAPSIDVRQGLQRTFDALRRR